MNIPKIVHFYWDGSLMSYLNYMTVVSFHKHNPDYEIRIYTPKTKSSKLVTWQSPEQKVMYNGKDYWDQIQNLEYVKILKVDFDSINGIPKDISEIHRSDFLRYILLGDVGGVWSDFDILYVRPLDEIIKTGCEFGSEETDTVISFDGRHFIIGFFMASTDNAFFKDVFSKAVQFYSANGYQSIGCSLLMGVYKNFDLVQSKFPELKFANLKNSTLYPVFYESMEALFNGQFKHIGASAITPSTVGIHWYNGHQDAKHFCNSYDPENPTDCLITDLIKEMNL